MEGNQRASLPWNLGRLRGISISIRNYDTKKASQPQSEWKVTKELLFLRTLGDCEASLCQSRIVTTKGLLYVDLNGR